MKRVVFGVLIPFFMFAEGISFNGRFNVGFTSRPVRRDTVNPANTLQIGIGGGINIFGISAGLNLFFNSDDKFTPRASSFYSLTPTWGWGRAYIGDFAPSFSSFSLSGVSMRGGGLELFPGKFNLFIVSGVVKGAEKDSTSSSYSKYMWGVKLGFGKSSRANISILNSKDIPSSLEDSLRGNKTPEENWVFEIGNRVVIKKIFSIKATGAVSMLTRNIYASPVTGKRVPSWLKSGLNLNLSSNVDYAYSIKTGLRLKKAILNYRHSYIGPGFESHGLAGIANDRVEDGGSINFSLGRYGSLGASGSYYRDNLVGLKDSDTRNLIANVFLSLVPTRKLSFTTTAMMNRMNRNSAQSDTQSVSNRSVSLSVSSSYRPSKKVSLGINSSITEAEVLTIFNDVKTRIIATGARLNHRLARSFSYGLGFGVVSTNSDTLNETSLTPSINIRFVPGKKLRFMFGLRSGISKKRNFLGTNVRGIVRVTSRDAVTLRLTSENYTDSTPPTLTIHLSYSRAFGKKVY